MLLQLSKEKITVCFTLRIYSRSGRVRRSVENFVMVGMTFALHWCISIYRKFWCKLHNYENLTEPFVMSYLTLHVSQVSFTNFHLIILTAIWNLNLTTLILFVYSVNIFLWYFILAWNWQQNYPTTLPWYKKLLHVIRKMLSAGWQQYGIHPGQIGMLTQHNRLGSLCFSTILAIFSLFECHWKRF